MENGTPMDAPSIQVGAWTDGEWHTHGCTLKSSGGVDRWRMAHPWMYPQVKWGRGQMENGTPIDAPSSQVGA